MENIEQITLGRGGGTPYKNILLQLAPNFSWSLNQITSSYHSDIKKPS